MERSQNSSKEITLIAAAAENNALGQRKSAHMAPLRRPKAL